jgi:hypothetical protein
MSLFGPEVETQTDVREHTDNFEPYNAIIQKQPFVYDTAAGTDRWIITPYRDHVSLVGQFPNGDIDYEIQLFNDNLRVKKNYRSPENPQGRSYFNIDDVFGILEVVYGMEDPYNWNTGPNPGDDDYAFVHYGNPQIHRIETARLGTWVSVTTQYRISEVHVTSPWAILQDPVSTVHTANHGSIFTPEEEAEVNMKTWSSFDPGPEYFIPKNQNARTQVNTYPM